MHWLICPLFIQQSLGGNYGPSRPCALCSHFFPVSCVFLSSTPHHLLTKPCHVMTCLSLFHNIPSQLWPISPAFYSPMVTWLLSKTLAAHLWSKRESLCSGTRQHYFGYQSAGIRYWAPVMCQALEAQKGAWQALSMPSWNLRPKDIHQNFPKSPSLFRLVRLAWICVGNPPKWKSSCSRLLCICLTTCSLHLCDHIWP